MQSESLGAAERIIQTALTYSDHMVHNRPGMVIADPNAAVGVTWRPVTHRDEEGQRVVYRLDRKGRKTVRTKVGRLQAHAQSIVDERNRVVGEYCRAGLFPEVVAWLYRQVSEVYALDHEFAARWASYAFGQEHRDLRAWSRPASSVRS